ncbi:hypothetical protein VPAG_00027 [Vibrio phage douglas 12A4]|uniref:hypothetical protein n=1 Tax=Vibrio phage douglas 12A4 TaxID=573171 RepID=UPI0002C0B0AF|nr:hypothetical protein VPAG_00027 [Vibrio phage douglas 12A4]AGG58063.1 hypothetical protein VPAG_00027 [Vibrio phage douglas 12A4]
MIHIKDLKRKNLVAALYKKARNIQNPKAAPLRECDLDFYSKKALLSTINGVEISIQFYGGNMTHHLYDIANKQKGLAAQVVEELRKEEGNIHEN